MLITTVRICGHVYCWVSAKPVSANREDTVAVATDCLSAGAAWTHNPAPGPGGTIAEQPYGRGFPFSLEKF